MQLADSEFFTPCMKQNMLVHCCYMLWAMGQSVQQPVSLEQHNNPEILGRVHICRSTVFVSTECPAIWCVPCDMWSGVC